MMAKSTSSKAPARSISSFPPPSYSGRGTQQHDAQIQFRDHFSQRQRGTDGTVSDDVVPAGVPDVRQRIVFSADAHGQRAGAEDGAQAGIQTEPANLDVEACLFQRSGDAGHRAVLVERGFRVGMQGRGQAQQGVAARGRRAAVGIVPRVDRRPPVLQRREDVLAKLHSPAQRLGLGGKEHQVRPSADRPRQDAPTRTSRNRQGH